MAKLAKKAGKVLGSVSGLGLLANFAAGAVSKGKKAADPAKVAPADPRQTVMPSADDDATQRAKRRSIIEQRRRSGRMSTILTDGSDKLGG
jgi:hypothetical protein